jgi:hypothetical protein
VIQPGRLVLALGVAGCNNAVPERPPEAPLTASATPAPAPSVGRAASAAATAPADPPVVATAEAESPAPSAEPSALGPPHCAPMPAARPRDFSVGYQFCRSPPMKGIHCAEGEIVGGGVRCTADGQCTHAAAKTLDGLYAALRAQGFWYLREGERGFGPRHGSDRLRVTYGGQRCEVTNTHFKPVAPADRDRFYKAIDRVVEVVRGEVDAGGTTL